MYLKKPKYSRASSWTVLVSVRFWSAYLLHPNYDLDRLTLPVPDDGFHAEALEYIALIDSIQRAGDSFCAVELGQVGRHGFH